ncbi:MAG: LysE family translocator [Pseudomonadota bacterium]
MTPEHLIAFNVALLFAIASPGPALLVATQTALAHGRTAGIAVGIGLALMASIWTLLALLGLDAVFALVPWAYGVVKIAGAIFLLWIAYSTWRGARKPLQERQPVPAARAFRTGFFINLLNPKSVLFSAAVLVVIFPQGLSLMENATIMANHFALEVVCYSALSCMLTTPAVARRYLAAKVWLDRAAALILGALGLRLLLSR